jgi:hypothetical protein
MNRIFKISSAAAVLTLAVSLQSCSLEAPFESKGEGTLTIVTDIRGDVEKKTRAIDDETLTTLREQCVVYIENSKGVIRKYKGVDNIPQDIRLSTGSYVAEAWSGDSVSASFSSKFYRGYEKFDIKEGANSLTLNCNIANVIASVNPESLDCGLSDMKVTFSHSRGELEFTEDNISIDKGYFMMPSTDTDLSYKVSGTKSDGSSFERTGTIPNVQRAHEYELTVTTEDRPITEGGALIRITIADIPVIEDTVEVFTAPLFQGVDYNLNEQVISLDGNFTDTKVYVRGYFGMSSIIANFSDNFVSMTSGRNILDSDVISDLQSSGINVEVRKSIDAVLSGDAAGVEVDEVYITFSKAFLEALPASDSEYKITFEATDGRHNSNSASLRIANSANAVEKLDPVVTPTAPDENVAPMAITSTTATLDVPVYDSSLAEYGLQYRQVGQSSWITVKASAAQSAAARRKLRATPRAFVATRSSDATVSVTITGLTAGTTYEYRAYATDFVSSTVNTFTTEKKFTFPNASFEEWDTYSASTMLGTKNVVFPGTGSRSFWDSGNEGAATANMTLTNKSTDMVHSGTYSACLASSKAFGVLAAGNVFAGSYVKTDGTNGVLSLGRDMGFSTHPSKVAVYANYRPGIVDIIKSGNESYLDFTTGENDHGQIYIAIVDEPIDIRTNPSNQKLFDPNDSHVIAYGQVTWKDNFGADGQLQRIEIPFTYYDRAKTTRATYIVVTCCASKFGDFFSGSSSSVLYLDDFELVYE